MDLLDKYLSFPKIFISCKIHISIFNDIHDEFINEFKKNQTC